MSYFIDRHFGKLLIVGFAVVIAAITALANSYTSYQCRQYESVTGRPTRYVQFDSCYVQRDGRFYRWEEYKLAYVATGATP